MLSIEVHENEWPVELQRAPDFDFRIDANPLDRWRAANADPPSLGILDESTNMAVTACFRQYRGKKVARNDMPGGACHPVIFRCKQPTTFRFIAAAIGCNIREQRSSELGLAQVVSVGPYEIRRKRVCNWALANGSVSTIIVRPNPYTQIKHALPRTTNVYRRA
ncbi:hypothetical protein [Paraburkholderia largidicola]|uniref:hypothetical protein n=1 Tax=Paraburkholderia largidicola TaxID=3014751 RepID=UPI0015DA5ABD|nr:hypothetical protein [Paraburkholderia sp. PGU16]